MEPHAFFIRITELKAKHEVQEIERCFLKIWVLFVTEAGTVMRNQGL